MPSVDFLQTMVSHNPKKLFLKFELLAYDETTEDFKLVDEGIVMERQLPNGLSNVSGGISINVEQDVRTTLDIEITNAGGINNWGADFDPDDPDTFKWWLDKRLNFYLGLALDGSQDVEFIQMGHFIITHFKTNHNLTTYPVTNIQGASKEVLYASRRGKFLFPSTIRKNAVMVDTIKTILINGGEKEGNIFIDPQINPTSIKLDYGEVLSHWTATHPGVSISLDRVEKAHGDSSIKIDVNSPGGIRGVIAEKEYQFPIDMSRINAIALWSRCSRDVPEGGISLVLIDDSGERRDLPLRELVGHVIEGGTILPIENWRNVVLGVDRFHLLTKIRKIQIKVNTEEIKTPFTLWLDQIYCAEIRNMLPYDLTYGAGQSKWQAVKELANLLDCHSFYDEYGHFVLEKRKFPKERFSNDFEYDAYEVLQPLITYRDTDEMNNLYGGTDDLFEEHELSNHIQVVGGSTNSNVMTLIDMVLHTDGLYIKEKGKIINSRGKIRAIDQFLSSSPTILNGDTRVEEVYKGHKNLEAVLKEYPNGFPHLEEPPISNFAVEKIGDFIYHHNNANPDPLIVYAYEGKNRALWELRNRLAYAEQLNILSAPYYILRGHDIIRVEDSMLGLNENFQIKSINIPLNGDYMSISANKIKNLIIDVPYFDISPLKANACWYGYDACGLSFTYPF